MSAKEIDGREKLIQAAESLFAQKGFDAVSLREITLEAGMNVASVNYHFGSKEKLIEEIITQHIHFLSQERLRLLDEYSQTEEIIPIEKILYSFMEPKVRLVKSRASAKELFCKLMGRMMAERGYGMPASIAPQIKAMVQRYAEEFQKTVPELSSKQSYRAVHYMFSVLAMMLMHGKGLEIVSNGQAEMDDFSLFMDEYISFCTGGILNIAQQNQS